MKVLMIKASNYSDVRLSKYSKVFQSNDIEIDFLGWNRDYTYPSQDVFNKITYLLKGFGYSNKWLPIAYLIWMVKLFFYLLFNFKRYNYVYVADFEAAFPVFISTIFRPRKYIYDIYDEFAIRYKFPTLIKYFIKFLDRLTRKKSFLLIHVDESRLSKKDKNFVIIKNTPFDWYNDEYKGSEFNKLIAITGNLTEVRGVDSIAQFIESHPEISFIIYGRIVSKKWGEKIENLKNVDVRGFVPQVEVFEGISNASAIFALYDPSIEINRKAASNKIYDCMMLGIPIITNDGILMSDMVKEYGYGISVKYDFDKSWNRITEMIENKSLLAKYGKNCRDKYESGLQFDKLVKTELLSKIK